jgi:oligopeptidase A
MPIQWQLLTPDYLRREIPLALEKSQANVDAIAAIPLKSASFFNVVEALEYAADPIDCLWNKLSHLENVASDETSRAIFNEFLGNVVEFHNGIILNEALWERIRSVQQTAKKKNLTRTQARLLEETYQSFVDNGANLSPSQKELLRDVQKQLTQKTQKYGENVMDAIDGWEKIIPGKDVGKLDGLPETIVAILKAGAEKKGHENAYRLTLHAPVYGPCMRYLKSDELRQELWRAHTDIGRKDPFDNGALIGEILALRRKEAQYLSRENFADLVLHKRMAKSGKAALAFTERIHGSVLPFFLRDVGRLEDFKAEVLHRPTGRLEPWEVAYFSELQCQKLHGFSEEQLRPYFEINAVLGGIFQTFQQLYGIRFCPRATSTDPESNPGAIPVWHGDVRYYDVYEKDGHFLGSFYLDLHPRKGKRSGAWMDGCLRHGYRDRSGEWVTPIGFVAGNLTPSTDSQPSLLTHYEVEILFHEFGHLIHHLMGKVDYASLNGTNVARDFVELPSQLMENWVWDREALNFFAKHYRDGTELPDALFEKMTNARLHNVAIGFMRQLSMQKLDLDLHCSYKDGDVEKFVEKSTENYLIPYGTKAPSIVHQFLHLFDHPTGYAAAYYSYKWAEVLEADAFTRFQKNGIFSKKIANLFRRQILERGNEATANALFRQFMGRDPKLDALLRRYGMEKK